MSEGRRLLGTAVLASAVAVSCGDGGGTAPTAVPMDTNHPATATITMSPSGAAVAAATVLTFTATATDPDGDAVALNWQFGDGESASGAVVRHTFVNPGAYTVALTATDARGAAATTQASVAVKNLTGTWVDIDPEGRFTLTQTGAAVSGNLEHQSVLGALEGVVEDPRDIGFYLTFRARRYLFVWFQYRCRYEGALDETGDRFQVRIVPARSAPNCRHDSFTVTRRD